MAVGVLLDKVELVDMTELIAVGVVPAAAATAVCKKLDQAANDALGAIVDADVVPDP